MDNVYTYTNIFYFELINCIGGIETYLWEIAKKYCDYDITLVYKGGDSRQIERLSQFIRCHKYEEGQRFKCKKAFYNLNIDAIDFIEAEEQCLVLHGDYKSLGKLPRWDDRITRVISVSKRVKDGYKELTGRDSEVCYNPLTIEETDKERVLLLISATRLTEEKGGPRYIKLANELINHNIKFIWLFFTDDKDKINIKGICPLPTTLEIRPYIKMADALVQLSDSEGFGYSAIEAWELGTPVISTKIPVITELGANKDNSILLDLDMNDIPIDEIKNIYKKKNKFKANTPPDRWGEILDKKKSNYRKEKIKMYLVEALDTYEKNDIADSELGHIPKPGEQWKINATRLNVLTGGNTGHQIYVKVVKEITPEQPKEEVKEEKPKKATKKAKK